MKNYLLLLFFVISFFYTSHAQISARLFRTPDVSATQIVFMYGGDIWIVDKEGGTAAKLSSPPGSEFFPRFSPDGTKIAFSGNYDGNVDIYVMPVLGGVPDRITYHGMADRINDWYPTGDKLLYTSSRESGKQRFSQFYKVDAKGGLSEKLPLAYGEYGSLSPDGKQIAFNERAVVNATWKRYRGGMNGNLWIFDLDTYTSTNISNTDAGVELPMWHGDKIYYMSDRGKDQRSNIWVYDIKAKTNTQVTSYTDFDIHWPSIGPDDIVYEGNGDMYLLDLKTNTSKIIKINVISDLITLKPRKEGVSKYANYLTISPDGNRALVEARGEIFSLPSEEGYIQNLTRSSGVAERYPAWSPDGKYVAYWSDKSGEYELTVRDLTKGSAEEKLTSMGPGYRYNIYWSPDSKKMVFVDQTMTINMFNMETKTVEKIDHDPALFEGNLEGWKANWSSDSQWLTYSRTMDNGNAAIFIYNTKTKALKQATSGFYSDRNPTFDPDGKYLYLTTNRSFNPTYSDFDNSWSYPNSTELAAITLTKEQASPLSTKNDTVAVAKTEEKKEEPKDDKASKTKKDKKTDVAKEDEKKDDESKPKETKIDFDNFEMRLVILPPAAGNIGSLSAASGKVAYERIPNTGSGDEDVQLKYFDFEDREEKTIMSKVNAYEMSADGKKLLVAQDQTWSIIDFDKDQTPDKHLSLNDMEMTITPMDEWKQIFTDSWRFMRDFFYDPAMHGVDWNAIRVQYGNLINNCISRADVNFVIGDMIGELNASHTYRFGGDSETPKERAVGYLGVDWTKKDGYFAIGKVVRGAAWDNEVRSSLDEPGVNVGAGDYILAVNGIALNEYPEPWAAFEGLADKTVELTVNSKPSWDGAKTVVVKTMSDETRLRNLAWIEENRKKVDEASGGKIGYIYVPDTGVEGQNELVRQFYGQWNKEGLIIDERFNNGGQIPDRFIELLNRKPLAYWDVRDGKNWQWPPVGHFGSMAMLINGWSGSGGDAFPDFFRKAGLGPLIGGRTWGGLIGISGAPQLIDGGAVTVPTFRMYNPDGTWFLEGHGVDPDIEVKEDPTLLAKGVDPQIQRAVDEVMKSIQAKGPIQPKTPQPENRARNGKT
ncbi:MAG: PD40 domain-containing protein [Saprospiraceae bacterium]|uniref:Tricorn protease homolog n=1 Tax=Candidatus Opimibacter skivensis TaxID=2982028 RepID=A0A9D7XRP4_9BACT|nr:PD40 domain-containing protein [Candidatus Opimibacter skivensis]